MNLDYQASPNHSSREGVAIAMIVMHATVGSYASSLDWLRNPQPAHPEDRVSSHYLIRKDGHIAQLVADDQAAWHAGVSHWRSLDSKAIQRCSVSIELENSNTGRDPYPLAQLQAARELCRRLIAAHSIAPAAVVRHLDIAPKRKTDPAGLDWPAFLASLDSALPDVPTLPAPEQISADALLLHSPRASQRQCIAWLCRGATGGYTRGDIARIVNLYYAQPGGIDPLLAIAQMAHETGSLTSYWSQRPRRNPAGLGVTGQHGAGLHFAMWELSVRAHVGRLLAYALPAGAGSPVQRALIDGALALRPMPISYRGAAARLSGLSGRWAVPGLGYAEKIASIASAIRTMP